jgi:hypothetical protein
LGAVYRCIDQTALLTAFTPANPEADAVLRSAFPRPLSSFPEFELFATPKKYRLRAPQGK